MALPASHHVQPPRHPRTLDGDEKPAVERDVPAARIASTMARRLLLAGVFGLSGVCVLRIAAVPTETVAGNVLIDDAFYYVIPAQHLVAGQGYSFDGEARTNGVQPLWAAVCVGLVAALPRDGAVLHAMVLLCGLFWIAAGAVLYRAVRRYDPWTAALIAVGWLLIGWENRMALQGMENGLHALLFASILAFGVRYLRRRASRPAGSIDLGSILGLGCCWRFSRWHGSTARSWRCSWGCWSSRGWCGRAASDGRDGISPAPHGSPCPASSYSSARWP